MNEWALDWWRKPEGSVLQLRTHGAEAETEHFLTENVTITTIIRVHRTSPCCYRNGNALMRLAEEIQHCATEPIIGSFVLVQGMLKLSPE